MYYIRKKTLEHFYFDFPFSLLEIFKPCNKIQNPNPKHSFSSHFFPPSFKHNSGVR